MSFNTKRFVQTVRWTETTLLSHSIKLTAIMAVVLFLITLMAPHGEMTPDSIEAVSGTTIAVLTFFFIGYGTQLMSDMRKQQGRLFAMMLPASTLEKYLARLLHITVGTLVLSVLATMGADVLSMVYRLAYEGQLPSSLTWAMLTDTVGMLSWMGGGADLLWSGLTGILMVVFAHSFFVLGGMFFRRASLPLSALVAFILMLIFGFSAVSMLGNDVELNINEDYVIDKYSVIAVFDGMLLLLTVLFHLAAYHLFRRLQLINNKWVNV